jgi:hypothetical protein
MKCFLRLLTLGTIFSVNFASSAYVSYDDESPSPMGIAETSSPKPYNILGMGQQGGEILKDLKGEVSITSTHCTALGFKCRSDGIGTDSYPDPNAPCPLQID